MERFLRLFTFYQSAIWPFKGYESVHVLYIYKNVLTKCIIWALTRENLSSVFTNNKSADQPTHPHWLISAFVIRLLESILSKLATREIFNILASLNS